MPRWRDMTEQIDWRAKHLLQVACFSEDLKCWGAWDTTCGRKAKDIDRLQEGGVERGSTRRSSLNVRERAIVSQTNIGTVSKATFWETGWSAYGLFRAHMYHFERKGTGWELLSLRNINTTWRGVAIATVQKPHTFSNYSSDWKGAWVWESQKDGEGLQFFKLFRTNKQGT